LVKNPERIDWYAQPRDFTSKGVACLICTLLLGPILGAIPTAICVDQARRANVVTGRPAKGHGWIVAACVTIAAELSVSCIVFAYLSFIWAVHSKQPLYLAAAALSALASVAIPLIVYRVSP
jgi:hypothetical protein